MSDRSLPVRLVCRDGDHEMCPHEADAPWCGCSCHTPAPAPTDDRAGRLSGENRTHMDPNWIYIWILVVSAGFVGAAIGWTFAR